MARSLRMPISIAYRKGLSAVAATAETQRVVLTSHGRPVAVVDSAERIDESLRTVREAARLVVENLADVALHREPARLTLDEVCAMVGVDVDRVRARSEQLRTAQ